jgi:pimeloyl-ACP methyl ester carboxylesterase
MPSFSTGWAPGWVISSDAQRTTTTFLWEQTADDARAVLDAVGSERAVICGVTDSGPAAILFAGSHPSRTRGLVLINTQAGSLATSDYPVGLPEDEMALLIQFVIDAWVQRALANASVPTS